MPPDMPAAKLRPVAAEHEHRRRRSCTRSRGRRRPRRRPSRRELRTAKRSPARPRTNSLAGGRAVQRDVAEDDVAPRPRSRRRPRAPTIAGRPRGPCRVVVALAVELERRGRACANAPKLWPAVPQSSRTRPRRRPGVAVAARDLARQQRADAAVGVAHRRRRSAPPRRASAAPAGEQPAVDRRATARPWSWPLGAGARARGPGPAAERPDRGRSPGPPVASAGRSRSVRPTSSSKRRTPSSRHQLAHLLGDEQQVAARRARACRRSAGAARDPASRCPTGHVLRWQTRIITQPAATSGAVEKPNSSAPSSAPMSTSRPVRRPPSTCSRTRPRSAVADEHLLRLGEAELPRQAGVLERRQRRGAGAAVVAGDHDVLGLRPWRRRRRSCRRPPRRRA